MVCLKASRNCIKLFNDVMKMNSCTRIQFEDKFITKKHNLPNYTTLMSQGIVTQKIITDNDVAEHIIRYKILVQHFLLIRSECSNLSENS